METQNQLGADEGWGVAGTEEWTRLQALLELVRREHRAELTPERREEIREHVMERLERNEIRRRRVRTFVTAASAVLLAGFVLTAVIRARAS